MTGADFSSLVVVRSACKRSAARPKSSVALIASGMVAIGVTWPVVPRARRVTRGTRSLSNPIERKAGFDGSAVSAEVSRISSVVASVSFQLVVNERLSARSSGSVFPAWIFTWLADSGSVPTSVSSISVSGRNSRCCLGSSTVRNPV